MATPLRPGSWPDDRARILLADAEPANLLALHAILQELGHDLVEAPSAAEALRCLGEAECAVVLLDTQLPDLGGLETVRQLRERSAFPQVPVIFIAPASGAAFSAVQAYTLGAVDYLIRPLEPVIVRAKVAGLVELFCQKQRAEHQAKQLRLLIESTTDYAIFLLDPEGRISTWNTGAERIKGYRAEDIIGQHVTRFYTPEAVARNWPGHELKVAAATGRFEDEGWRLRKDGSRFWANVVITALRDADGRLLGFSKITRDLTERRKAEEALRAAKTELETRVQERTAELAQANESLREADRRKDEFLAMLAHELRNPLAPVRNALQIMKMLGLSAETLRQAREMVERQVHHLVRLVDDLLDVSRIIRGKIELQKEPVDLATVFTRAVETAQPIIDAQGHELTVALPDERIWVEGDVVRLAQVVNNLLVNAAKYTDQAGRIWLTGERDGMEAVIRVRDAGLGIEPQLLPCIFDLFVQADRSLARSQGGLGIGLTMVRRLAELHGGRVSASSAGPGQGSEFVVRLPARAVEATDKPSAEDRPRPAAGPSRRVLVVDDNVDAAESAAMLLRLLGHQVKVAHDGNSALDAVKDFRPEIVLLDIGLPGRNGYEVAQAIRAQPENQGVVLAAVTGYGQEQDRRRSQEAGFDYHLTKPLAPNALMGFVDAQPRAS